MTKQGADQKPFANAGAPRYKAIVVGTSAGGLEACNRIFSPLPKEYPLPIVIVQHINPDSDKYLGLALQRTCVLTVEVAEDKQPILPGHIYFAPCDYHLLVERGGTFSLSIDERVNHSRPSIDVLFECAARAWTNMVIGILLTGASKDGAEGLRAIKEAGGLTIVQDPREAEYSIMPESALALTKADKVLSLRQIEEFLLGLGKEESRRKDK